MSNSDNQVRRILIANAALFGLIGIDLALAPSWWAGLLAKPAEILGFATSTIVLEVAVAFALYGALVLWAATRRPLPAAVPRAVLVVAIVSALANDLVLLTAWSQLEPLGRVLVGFCGLADMVFAGLLLAARDRGGVTGSMVLR